eukprot:g2400.t1
MRACVLLMLISVALMGTPGKRNTASAIVGKSIVSGDSEMGGENMRLRTGNVPEVVPVQSGFDLAPSIVPWRIADAQSARGKSGGEGHNEKKENKNENETNRKEGVKFHRSIHDHIVHKRRGKQANLAQSYERSSTHARSLSGEFEAIRISTHYLLSGSSLSTEKKDFLKTEIMAHAVQYWQETLSVRRVSGPLFAKANCTLYFFVDTEHETCNKVDSQTTCQGYPMPSAWVASMKYYSSCFSDKTCTGEGSSAQGSGIENTDFQVIVTADATEACLDGSGTLAYASACQYDDNDRPTFAHVNFCPSSVINDDSISVQRSTAIHELAHALGFSSETWPRMRQSDGVTRRTPLDRGEYTCINGNTRSDFLAPADTVIQRMTLRSRPNSMLLVTPAVAVAARNHYGCETLAGAELENQPTTANACVPSHWEERTLKHEIMTPVVDGDSIMSALTLAMFEDTGWYKANYEKAEYLHWGRNAGCDFVSKKCLDDDGSGGTVLQQHFCDGSSEADACVADLTATGQCTITNWSADLPQEFQYFDGQPRRGGPFKELDFCPYVTRYSNRVCTNANLMSSAPGYLGQTYSASSRCIISSAITKDYVLPAAKPRCIEVACHKDNVAVTVKLRKSATSSFDIICGPDEEGTTKNIVDNDANGFIGAICKTCNVKIQEESRVFFDVMLLVILSWGLAYYIVWTIPDIPAYITVLTYDSPDCKPGTLRSVENFPRSVCVVNENKGTSASISITEDYEHGLSWGESRFSSLDCTGDTELEKIERSGNFAKMYARAPSKTEALRRGKSCVVGDQDNPCYGPNPFIRTCIRRGPMESITLSGTMCMGDSRINPGDALGRAPDEDEGVERDEVERKPDAGGRLVLGMFSDRVCLSLVKAESHNISSYLERGRLVPFTERWLDTYKECTEGRGKNANFFFKVLNADRSDFNAKKEKAGVEESAFRNPAICNDPRHFYSKEYVARGEEYIVDFP